MFEIRLFWCCCCFWIVFVVLLAKMFFYISLCVKKPFIDGLCFSLSLEKKKLLEETSIFTTHLRIRELRESRGLSKTHERLVKVIECGENEPVCCDWSSNPKGPFCFSIQLCLQKLNYAFPFPFLRNSS